MIGQHNVSRVTNNVDDLAVFAEWRKSMNCIEGAMRFDEILACGGHRRFFGQVVHIRHHRVNFRQICWRYLEQQFSRQAADPGRPRSRIGDEKNISFRVRLKSLQHCRRFRPPETVAQGSHST